MKPNIVIVMTDQHRADLRKSRGYPLDTMPFLDSLARQGTDLECAYTPCPACLPARVSMLTGRYAQSHRARTNHNGQDALYTADLLDVLKAEGYTTALCGKNHSHRADADFDFAQTCGHLGREGNLGLETTADAELADFLDATHHLEAHSPAPGGVQAQHPYRNVSSAFSFLDSRPANSPFFLWLSFAEPHNPYQVPAPYYDMFPPEALPQIETTPQDGAAKGHKYAWLHGVWQQVLGADMPARILRARSNYHGMLRLIDDQLKRFFQGLQQRGLADDTIVVFLSDHGDFAGEYGLIRKGADLPEVLLRIPMTWWGPGVTARGVNGSACASLVDVLPTLCHMLGLDTPVGVQGKSLYPLLQAGAAVPAREYACAYAENGYGGLYWTPEDSLTPCEEGAMQWFDDGPAPGLAFDCLNTWTQCGQVRMLRKGAYKLQLDMLGNGYLYNVQQDPMETRNLYHNRAFEGTRADMLAELVAAGLRACDPLPLPRRRYHYKQHPQGYWFDTDFTL